MVPTGRGDYLGLNAPLGHAFQRIRPHPWLYLAGPHVPTNVPAVWGDTLLRFHCCEGSPHDGWLEWVRYGPGVEPGDLLWLIAAKRQVNTAKGFMLYRIGPRGGAAPVWDAPNEELGFPVGMGVAPDGSTCVADWDNGMLWDYASDGRGAPTTLRLAVPTRHIVDCLYEDDGAIQLLLRDPPRIERIPAGTDAPKPVSNLDPDSLPIQLVRTPDGGVKVIERTDGVLGAVMTPAGVEASIRADEPTTLLAGDDFTAPPPSALASLAVRPDGLVVVQYYWIPADQGPSSTAWITPLMAIDPGEPGWFPIVDINHSTYFRAGGLLDVVPGGTRATRGRASRWWPSWRPRGRAAPSRRAASRAVERRPQAAPACGSSWPRSA